MAGHQRMAGSALWRKDSIKQARQNIAQIGPSKSLAIYTFNHGSSHAI
jgi:hypothetical protein